MLEKMMIKLNGMEEKLHQKADVKAVADLECRIKLLNSLKIVQRNVLATKTEYSS